DDDARAELLNAADVVILCLPDDAAKAAVGMITNTTTKVIDASTAHRTASGWAYGFPEMAKDQRAAIKGARLVSNPGCYPTGFIALTKPLVEAEIIPADFPITVNAISGYSGGGKGLIAEFEAPAPKGTNDAVRVYGLNLAHKHLPEMQQHTGLAHPPVFAPSVGRYAQGMIVEVPLQLWALPGRPDPSDLHGALQAAYAGEAFVAVASASECAELAQVRAGAGGYVAALDPEALNGTNRMKLYVFPSADRTQARLVAVLDNLGKGASGAAVQNLNLMLGLEEGAGLQ
ncbi:N-acetyl-gamma-glutamyl-phosphate reductase, partial [Phenylobacterium sp.]|uniref:N-acetyl-gamma-glutamyl-phosphate reductase n=1 Tax=Phenylobacterium sp. TaxID=1871053 RepID=UPI00374CFB14